MPADKEKSLNYKRGNIKSRITVFGSYLKQIDSDKDSNTNDGIVHELEHRLSHFTNILNEFENVQFDIEMLEDDPQPDVELRNEISNKYYKYVGLSKSLIEYFVKKMAVVNNVIASQNTQANVRLPTLALPNFDGNLDNWMEFRDSFNSIIHKNCQIDAIQKFQYLKSSLTGVAANLIKSLPVSEANYETAWGMVCNRFDNKNALIFNHVKSLCNLPKIAKLSAKSLRALLDETAKNLRALNNLDVSTDRWDILLIHILSEKLDSETVGKWEEHKFGKTLPTFEVFQSFLESRAQLLLAMESVCGPKDKFKAKESTNKSGNPTSHSFVSSSSSSCVLCKGSHKLRGCPDFLKLTSQERFEKAKSFKVCLNCLESGHFVKKCINNGCNKCHANHHMLLHFDKPKKETVENESRVAMTYTCCKYNVLLSTAVIIIFDNKGVGHSCRTLLDSGSQTSFISESVSKKLGLQAKRVEMSVMGINQVSSTVKSLCTVKYKSRFDHIFDTIDCLIVPEICSKIPAVSVNVSNVNIPKHTQLADPNFNISSKIDMLIGADMFWKLIGNEQIELGKNMPILRSSKFGWIVSGRLLSTPNTSSICTLSVGGVQEQLSRFWELEECTESKMHSPQEIECESYFVATTKRTDSGRFVVSVPLSDKISVLGDSRKLAERRFYTLERKLTANKSLKAQYDMFMAEYIDLGHMTPVAYNPNEFVCYLPHHGVLKEQSTTTKLRVVFDGSALTSSGRSLNSIQMVGPPVQDELFSILLRFRQHAYVVAADIAKMYRQVLIDPCQRNLQCILWRFDKSESLRTFQLNTVTYGTAAASFLATRCLRQLSIESHSLYPAASVIIERDFYVDDLLTSFEDIAEAINTCRQVDKILSNSGFELRKWISNNVEIINNISDDQNKVENQNLQFGMNENTKTLGLLWSSTQDALLYNINVSRDCIVTKRNILSIVSQIFDPLGLLSPCIISAKVMLQQLWLQKLDWDDRLSKNLEISWLQFQDNLIELNKLAIERQVLCKNAQGIELHGFADSSELAYGACVYLKSYSLDGSFRVRLLCAKSKVAPLKLQTIPRLELCAALLLSRLVVKVKASLTIGITHTYLWSDSTIALNWIQTPPHVLKTFVANRVAQIQLLTPNSEWRHVSSKDNVADLISRGVNPSDLLNCKTWWDGPSFLYNVDTIEPNTLVLSEIPELKNNHFNLSCTIKHSDIFDSFSNFVKLKRYIAYWLRFKYNCLEGRYNKRSGPLTVIELNLSLERIVNIVQAESFPTELTLLSCNKQLNKNSPIIRLNPFLDDKGLIRVGGRLTLADMSFNKRHPILLPKNHTFVDLLLKHEHLRLGHAGPQLLLYSIREQFWPLSGMRAAKDVASKCIKCFHVSPKSCVPQMGNLPKARVMPSLPFTTVGVDYAGPFMLKDRKGRGCKLQKGYVALFVCFVTKAVHLELVTDLSKDCFLSALRRFVSRRGKPAEIHSDNGTNFVGAANDLRELATFLKLENKSIANDLSDHNIVWRFIAPHSPHLGGLWEAGVKQVKHHLRRIVGLTKLTYEDFYTVLTQIEAILNSRPLSPMSSDPNDLHPLTPSHFLIGRSAMSVADPSLLTLSENRLSNYQLLQRMQQHFWSRWSKEYLNQLQIRSKNWNKDKDLQVGSMVLLKDENMPPLCWNLGRVVELHKGQDSCVRVVSIRTSRGIVKRAVSKLCQLPMEAVQLTNGRHINNLNMLKHGAFNGGENVGAREQ